MRAPPLVRCEDAGRTFGAGRRAVVAVHGATCAVTAGDRVAVTGPSGSGKSTLLHLLAGFEVPTVGVVDWPALGRRQTLRPSAVAMVFQTPALVPALDVVDNVAFPLLVAGLKPANARQRAIEVLRSLGLDGLADRLPDELSGGQAQRVALARALAPRPALLLADEPTGQLDASTARHVVEVLLAAAGQDMAVVVATHDPFIAGHLTRQWVMDDGRLRVDRCAGAR